MTEEDDANPEPTAKEREVMEELKKNVEEVTEYNKKVDDSYDERLRKLELKKRLKPENEKEDEEHLARVQVLKEEFEELKTKISTARRAGKDTFIASIMIKTIPAKIKMAEVTREEKDFNAVLTEIKRASEELEHSEKEETVDVKKEIEQRLKQELQRETGKVSDDDD